MRFISCCIIFSLAIISLYIGIGGAIKTENYNYIKGRFDFNSNAKVQSRGITYKNYAQKKLAEENEKAMKWFVFINPFPEWFGMVLTACFFGMLGGVILVIKQIALDGIKPEDTKYIALPFFGFLCGILTLGLTYLVPTILTENSISIRPITLQFLSLFAGIYSTYFFDFITNIVTSKIYPKK